VISSVKFPPHASTATHLWNGGGRARPDPPPSRRTLSGLLTAVVLVLGFLCAGASPATAAEGDIGYEGPSYTGARFPPTQDKPQSKMWVSGGTWWAVMWNSASPRYEIFRLDRSTQTWSGTGVVVDTRNNTLQDILWDGTDVYVASHVVTVSTDESPSASKANSPARLYRFSPSGASWSLDTGFPTVITTNSSESMTIDKDSGGTVWATWTQVAGSSSAGWTNQVYANSGPGGTGWGTPFVLPVSGSSVAPDDISAIVRFGGNKIGILWSNQLDETVYWAVHVDGQPTSSWTGRSAVAGNSSADDHLSIRSLDSDGAGRVFAVVKTSVNDTDGGGSAPQLLLLVYSSSTQSFTVRTVATVADCVTRPILVLDTLNQLVRVYFTAPNSSGCAYSGKPGSIYEKTASISSPTFVSGRGTPVIRDVDSANVNDPTTTKQSVNGSTGLVVMASNSATKRYWHNDISLTPGPSAQFDASTLSGPAPLSVDFTDTSTGSMTSRSWTFGDGATSTEATPTHVFTAPGSYPVTLTVTGPGGSDSVTRTVEVSASASAISFRGSSSAANTTATSVGGNLPSATQPGDLVVAAVSTRGAPTITAPSGWTLVRQDANGSTSRTAVYVRRAASGDPASVSWGLSSSQAAVVSFSSYSGVSSSTPVEASSGTVRTTSSRSVTAPSVTTGGAGRVVVGIFSVATAATFTPPAVTTERTDVATTSTTYKVSQELVDWSTPPAGATGDLTATSSTSSSGTAALLVLRPA